MPSKLKRKRSVATPAAPLEEQARQVLHTWNPTIPNLVHSLETSLQELRPLEEESKTLSLQLHRQRSEYLQELLVRYSRQERGEQLTLEEKVKAQAHLDSLHELSEELGDLASEKIQIATQVYDLIDAEIQRLDNTVSTIERDYPSETAVLRDVSAHREHTKRLSLRVQKPSTLSSGNGAALPMSSPSDVKYCLCQAPAHGKMLSCDNETCLVEWFHLSCVGLKEPPKVGRWYCPECFELLGDPNKPRKKRRSSKPRN